MHSTSTSFLCHQVLITGWCQAFKDNNFVAIQLPCILVTIASFHVTCHCQHSLLLPAAQEEASPVKASNMFHFFHLCACYPCSGWLVA